MHLGPRDIQIGAWQDSIAAGGKFNRRATCMASQYPLKLLYASLKYSLDKRKLQFSPSCVNHLVKRYMREHAGFGDREGAHVGASKVMAYDRNAWKNYFKFCFVRNPWDHAVSDYYWRLHCRGNPNVSFREFLLRLDDPSRDDPEKLLPPIRTNWEIYTINDEIAVDFVGRFENLDEDLSKVGRRIGISLDLRSVNESKGEIRNRKRSIEEHYDDVCIDLVSKIYAKEISTFSFEPSFT
jgi:hypothetical protein